MGFNSRSSRNQSKITAWCHKSYILPSVFYLSFGFRIYSPNRNIFSPDVSRIANPATLRRECRLQISRDFFSLISKDDV